MGLPNFNFFVLPGPLVFSRNFYSLLPGRFFPSLHQDEKSAHELSLCQAIPRAAAAGGSCVRMLKPCHISETMRPWYGGVSYPWDPERYACLRTELDARTVSPGRSQTYTSWTQPPFGEKTLNPNLPRPAPQRRKTLRRIPHPPPHPFKLGTGMNHASYTPKSNSI